MDTHEPNRLPPDWMEVRDLRSSVAVAAELNVKPAAERLFIAQPLRSDPRLQG